MSEAQQSTGLSKSARQRANKKAKAAAAAAEEAAAQVPEPAPVAKAAAKPKAKASAAKAAAAPAAAQPKAEPKAEPKGKAKAKAKAEPAAPEPQPKAKAKAKAEPAKVEEPAPPAPKAKAKSKAAAKSKAGAKAAAKPVEVEEKPEEQEMVNFVIDDGTGGEWEVASGLNKKQEKKKEKQEQQQKLLTANKANGILASPTQYIPGMGPLNASQAAGTAKAAAEDVARILASGVTVPGQAQPATGNVTSVIPIPERNPPRLPLIIGKGGKTISMLKEKTQATISTDNECVTIEGTKEAVSKAESAIREIIEKGYCSLNYEDFSENFVTIQKRNLPDLIGKEGCVVKAIKEKLSVEVSFPPMAKEAKDTLSGKVMLAGSAAQVERAKQCINNLILYGHDEITHPGEVHDEIECESWQYSFIIGPKGSQLRHIQKNWDVKVSIPREHSKVQNIVVVGMPSNVERAKTYIEKVLWQSENQMKGGRDKVESGDVWGDEDEEEEWMKAYMYKR